MVPHRKGHCEYPGGYTGGDITYKTINDYGALTEQVKGVVKKLLVISGTGCVWLLIFFFAQCGADMFFGDGGQLLSDKNR